jgi:hypothetical protein
MRTNLCADRVVEIRYRYGFVLQHRSFGDLNHYQEASHLLQSLQARDACYRIIQQAGLKSVEQPQPFDLHQRRTIE